MSEDERVLIDGLTDDGLRVRAVSALAFALSAEPDEVIYEAAHAVETPEDLVRQRRD